MYNSYFKEEEIIYLIENSCNKKVDEHIAHLLFCFERALAKSS